MATGNVWCERRGGDVVVVVGSVATVEDEDEDEGQRDRGSGTVVELAQSALAGKLGVKPHVNLELIFTATLTFFFLVLILQNMIHINQISLSASAGHQNRHAILDRLMLDFGCST